MAACRVAAPGAPGLPLPGELRDVRALRRVAGSLALEVWAPVEPPAPPADVELAWERGCEALAFVARELELAPHEPALGGPVRLVLLPDADFAQVAGAEGADGLAVAAGEGEGDALALPLGALAEPAELSDTLAHELVHVVQGRLVPGTEGTPWFVLEGMGLSAGARHGLSQHGRVTGPARSYLEDATGEEVAGALARFGVEDLTEEAEEPDEAHGLSESVGGLFVEHLRRTWPDVQARLLAAMAWAGSAGFDAAFSRAFDGRALPAVQREFLEVVSRTEGDWAARAAGTAFAPATGR